MTGPGDAPELLNNDPAGYAWGVWHDRTPKLLAQLRDALPFGPSQLRALAGLEEEIADGVVRPLAPDAHGAADWAAWSGGHFGQRWADTPFLWSESYFFRRLLEATGFFTPGPWHHLDPFAHLKTAELHDQAAAETLAALGSRPLAALITASLWGNGADLGFRIGQETSEPQQAGLVADDSQELLEMLGTATAIVIVADNAGRELLTDLMLIDHLLASDPAREVRLHVKPYPYYVSDATGADAVACLRRLGQPARTRLSRAAAQDRFTLHTGEFYCSPLPFDAMPAALAAQFGQADLTIMKGDLNYRRLVGDRAWPPRTPFQEVTAYFPGSVAALRTLKSDVLTGLDDPGLDPAGPWRTDGSRGLIQVRR